MPDNVNEWRFQQTTSAPGEDKKTITLNGPNAPHGRPRQKPVVSDGIEIREKTQYYPGNTAPTRLIFGSKFSDWELTGRFRDNYLGPGGAQDLAQQFIVLVDDAQPVLITWGAIVAATGFIKSFIPRREAPGDIAWEMKILIDFNAQHEIRGPQPTVISPPAMASEIFDELQTKIVKPLQAPKVDVTLKADFLDSVDDLVSDINQFSGALVDAANQIDDFDRALINDVQRLRAGVHQVRTAIITLRNVIQNSRDEAILVARSANSDIDWFSQHIDMNVASITTLALLQELDNQAELAERSSAITSITARLGDSWESLAIRAYADPNLASKIRNANGIHYGQKPQAGRSYVVPA